MPFRPLLPSFTQVSGLSPPVTQQFRPQDVREIQLRVYLSKPNTPIDVELSLMRAKCAGEG